jgi:hypothetical protein
VVLVHPGPVILGHLGVEGRHRAALARDLRGDALADLGLAAVVHEEVQLRLSEHVDEARGHHLAPHVDVPGRAGSRQVAHRHDPVPGHAHVGAEPRRARAVDDLAPRDHQVVIALSRISGPTAAATAASTTKPGPLMLPE